MFFIRKSKKAMTICMFTTFFIFIIDVTHLIIGVYHSIIVNFIIDIHNYNKPCIQLTVILLLDFYFIMFSAKLSFITMTQVKMFYMCQWFNIGEKSHVFGIYFCFF